MPHIAIQTNLALDRPTALDLAGKATARVAEVLGKSVAYVQTLIQPDQILTHGGTTEPAAYVRLKSIGLTEEECPSLSAAVCSLLNKELGIPAERIYVEFVDLPPGWFGWNKRTFA